MIELRPLEKEDISLLREVLNDRDVMIGMNRTYEWPKYSEDDLFNLKEEVE